MNFNELETAVIDWATDRAIFTDSSPQLQAEKTLEECHELMDAIDAEDTDETKDAIGDIMVTLILQAKMQGYDVTHALEAAYNVIKDRKGKMVNGLFVKEEDLTTDH